MIPHGRWTTCLTRLPIHGTTRYKVFKNCVEFGVCVSIFYFEREKSGRAQLQKWSTSLKRPTSKSLITYNIIVNNNTLEDELTRMTATNGLAFRIFIISAEMRKSLLTWRLMYTNISQFYSKNGCKICQNMYATLQDSIAMHEDLRKAISSNIRRVDIHLKPSVFERCVCTYVLYEFSVFIWFR